MKLYRLMTASAVVLLLSGLAYAEPTLGGTTGIIEMPTAEALRYKEWNVGVSAYPSSVDSSNMEVRYIANIGTFQGMELGFVGSSEREGVFINAKFYLMADNTKNPLSMALGIRNLASFHDTNVYLVTSKKFRDFSLHFGFSADLNKKVIPKVMAGTEFYLNKNASLLADITGTEDKWRLNAGSRFYLTSQLAFGISFLDILGADKEPGQTGNLNLVGQISWTDFL